MALTREIAREIVQITQSGGFYDGDIPQDDDELISLAEEALEEAKRSHRAGMKNEIVSSIIRIAEQQGNIVSADNKVEDSNPVVTADHFLEKFAKKENLPVPEELENLPEPMPSDLPNVPDRKIRMLSGYYNAYLSRVRWLLALATSDMSNAVHQRDAQYRKLYKKYHNQLSIAGERATKDLVDSYVKDDKVYEEWEQSVKEHQDKVVAFKTLTEIYTSNIDRLSRELTGRQNEWERTR